MCGHIFIGYHHHQALRPQSALWRCSVCGRQSHMPLDCCARPDYQVCRPESLVYAQARRLGALLNRLRTTLQVWLQRRPQADRHTVRTADEPLHAMLDAIERDAPCDDGTAETPSGSRELQLR